MTENKILPRALAEELRTLRFQHPQTDHFEFGNSDFMVRSAGGRCEIRGDAGQKNMENIKHNIDCPRFKICRVLRETATTCGFTVYAPDSYPLDSAHARILEAIPQIDVHWVKDCKSHSVIVRLAVKTGLVNLFRQTFCVPLLNTDL